MQLHAHLEHVHQEKCSVYHLVSSKLWAIVQIQSIRAIYDVGPLVELVFLLALILLMELLALEVHAGVELAEYQIQWLFCHFISQNAHKLLGLLR